MAIVGIPRSLLFYNYFPLWQTFFEWLGEDILVSEKTNKKTLDKGIEVTVDDICVPIKIFHGHIAELKDKVDYLFIPRIYSIHEDMYVCPKFQALPEMIKSSFKKLPKIISPTVDLFSQKNKELRNVVDVGKNFTDDLNIIGKAYHKAREAYSAYTSILKLGVLPSDIFDKKYSVVGIEDEKPTILLLGHPYILYDSFLNMDIINKLRDSGYSVITPDNFKFNEMAEIVNKNGISMLWTFGVKILGSMLKSIKMKNVAGIIYLSSFSCGLDSIISEIFEKRIKHQSKIPYTIITLDEHTGEAGVSTRVEAFLDMVEGREINEDYISTHGDSIFSHEINI